MTTQDVAQVTLDLDPELRSRLEAIAARKGVSLNDYCLEIICGAVDRDEGRALNKTEQLAALDRLDALRKEVFGDRVLPDSTPLFREMRGHRD